MKQPKFQIEGFGDDLKLVQSIRFERGRIESITVWFSNQHIAFSIYGLDNEPLPDGKFTNVHGNLIGTLIF